MIWKIATIALLAMAPAAFGAVTLQLETADGKTEAPMPADGVLTLNLMLDVGANDSVTGVTFAVGADQPGVLRLTGRELLNAVLTDPTTANGTLLGAANSLLNPKNGKDVGVGCADGVTPTDPGKQALMTLTFKVEPGATLNIPAHLSIVGVGAAAQGVWADPDFNTWPLPVTTFTITPEPASMLLLAAGAAFFARRRRA